MPLGLLRGQQPRRLGLYRRLGQGKGRFAPGNSTGAATPRIVKYGVGRSRLSVRWVARKPRRNRKHQPAGAVKRLPGPKRRLARTFSTLKDASAAGDSLLGEPLVPRQPLSIFDRGVLIRGVNALKSAHLLLEAMHWEFAAAPARQLFELLVNMEHLNVQDDREQSAIRYTKFGLLQTADYERQTGRPVNEARVATLERMRDSGYEEFRVVKGQRSASSWSGKSTRELAEASPKQPLRKSQYHLLFVAWSEQVHAAPATLLGGFFPPNVENIDQLIAEDLTRVAETGAMCVTLFTELWRQLPTLPELDLARALRWQTALVAEARLLGAPAPVLPDVTEEADG